jgi:hypothetical protein
VQLGDWCPVKQNKSPAVFEVLLSPIFEATVEYLLNIKLYVLLYYFV